MATAPERQTRPASVPDPMFPDPFRVRRLGMETHDTFTVELEPSDRKQKFTFAPGQFNMVYIHGAGEIPISISGNPLKDGSLVHTTRVVGTVTKAMRTLTRGDTVGVRGPFGTAWPVGDIAGHDVVIIAGGIGLAPLRPAIYHLIANREKYGKVVLLYGTRSPVDILYRREIESWRARFDFEVYVTVDRSMQGWKGNVGVVTALIPKSPFDPAHTAAMICGPEVMIRFTAMELLKRGVAAKDIYVSMERNMKCGIGFCGHCQFGAAFVCKDGPVFPYPAIRDLLVKWEI